MGIPVSVDLTTLRSNVECLTEDGIVTVPSVSEAYQNPKVFEMTIPTATGEKIKLVRLEGPGKSNWSLDI